MIKKITASTLALLIGITTVAAYSPNAALAAPRHSSEVHASNTNSFFNSGFWRNWGGNKVVIKEIDPDAGEVGTTVTLSGKRFNDESVVRFGRGVISDTDVSENGDTLSFTIPSEMGKYCPPYRVCTLEMLEVTPDDYKVQVQNGYRSSNAVWFEVTDSSTTTPDTELSIESIDGPTALSINEEGTWNLEVESEHESNLQYSVKWGDEAPSLMRLFGAATGIQTSSSFTHTYLDAGTFEPEFTVTDEEGNTVTKVAAKVVVGDQVSDVPSITTMSPNEALAGKTVTLAGTGFDADSTVTVGNMSALDVVVTNSSEITFTIPVLAAGTYEVTVTDTDGTSNMKTLTILEEKVKGKISVKGISAPTKIHVGETATWTVDAETNLDGNLQYSVDWGEGVMARGLRAKAMTQSSATFTHAYQTEGTYKPKFTVTDEEGNTASVGASVVVKGAQ